MQPMTSAVDKTNRSMFMMMCTLTPTPSSPHPSPTQAAPTAHEEHQLEAMTTGSGDDGDRAICPTCGQQYAAPVAAPPAACKICEDDRQWSPSTGQTWTSLGEMAQKGWVWGVVGLISVRVVP